MFLRAKLTTGFVAFKRFIQAYIASDIGDDTAGGDANVQTYLDARRPFLGMVTAQAGLPTSPFPPAGHFYLVRDAGSGEPAFFMSTGLGYVQVGAGGGGSFGVAAFAPVRAVAVVSLAPPGGYVAGELQGAGPINPADVDGVTLALGDSVLLTAEADPAHHGIWTLTQEDPFILARRVDAATGADLAGGRTVVVSEGIVNADTLWVITTDGPVVLDATPVYWAYVGVGGSVGPAPDSLVRRGPNGSIQLNDPPDGYGDPLSEGYAGRLNDKGTFPDEAIAPTTRFHAGSGAPPPGTYRHLELYGTEEEGIFIHLTLVDTGNVAPPVGPADIIYPTDNGWFQRLSASPYQPSGADAALIVAYMGL